MIRKIFTLLTIPAFVLSLALFTGCGDEAGNGDAADTVEDAANETEDAMEDAANEMEDTADAAADEMEDAANEASDAMDDY